jgi:hypothetical protein
VARTEHGGIEEGGGGMTKKAKSVATILEREVAATIKEWLRRVNLLPELIRIPLNDEDRAGHLPKLFHDLTCRLRLAKDAHLPLSGDAIAHGQRRRDQGYSPALLVEESRLFQVVTFRTLHLHKSELDQDQLLLDIMVIADEVDLQLMHAVNAFGTKITQPVV